MIGPGPASFAPATGPQGVWADLRLPEIRVEGELLEVRDSGLVLLRGDRVAFVPLQSIDHGRFRQRGSLIQGGEYVAEDTRAQLARLSRFPAGLSAERWAVLLAAYGQREIERVTP